MNVGNVIHSGPMELHLYIKCVFNIFCEFFLVKSVQ